MTFNELYLLGAIHKSGHAADTPKSDMERKNLARRVHEAWCEITGDPFFPFTMDDVVRWDSNHRKQMDCRMKAEIALAHGFECFWKHRNVGPCSDEAEAGHIVARSQGGDLSVANGIIECRFHNNERRDMSIEHYLKVKR